MQSLKQFKKYIIISMQFIIHTILPSIQSRLDAC